MTSTLIHRGVDSNIQVFGNPQLHTDSEIALLAFAPDGKLWTVENHGILRRWDTKSGLLLGWQPLSDLETHWAFSRDVRWLASANNDVAVWDLATGQLLHVFAMPGWVNALAFHPEGRSIATGHDNGRIRLCELGETEVQHPAMHYHDKPISALAFSPDGRTLAAAGEDKRITLWDTRTGKLLGLLVGHTDRIAALAWHPEGRLLVSAGWDTTARVWDVVSREPVILLNSHSQQVQALAFSPDGSLLASGDSDSVVHLWEVDSWTTRFRFRNIDTEIRSLAFSPTGDQIVCNGRQIIHVWNPETGEAQMGLDPHPVTPTTIALHPSNRFLATNVGGRAVRVFDPEFQFVISEIDTNSPVYALAFDNEGQFLFCGVDQCVRSWDPVSGKPISNWEGPKEPVTVLTFSPDGSLIAGGSRLGTDVWLWNQDGSPKLLLDDPLEGCSVQAVAFHPSSTQIAVGGIDVLATGGSEGAIAVWDLSRPEEKSFFLDAATALTFDASGERLIFAWLDNTLCILNLATQQIERELVGHDDVITSVLLSPDGRWFASASEDCTIRFWNLQGEDLATIDVESYVTQLACTADGRALFAGHANTTCSRIEIPADVHSED